MSREQAGENMSQSNATPMGNDTPMGNATAQSHGAPRDSDNAPVLSAATLGQLERICERLGADKERSPQMARQLVKRAGQLAVERGWSEAQALEYLLSLMLKASDGGKEPQSPL